MSAAVIICLILAMILLFISMILAALASSKADKNEISDSQKYAMWAAIASGLSIVLLIVIMFVYINSEKIVRVAHSALGSYVTQPAA